MTISWYLCTARKGGNSYIAGFFGADAAVSAARFRREYEARGCVVSVKEVRTPPSR